jgi:hypothetical protein
MRIHGIDMLIRRDHHTMIRDRTTGFAPPQRTRKINVELFAAVALVVSIAVSATAVSIGIARAQTAAPAATLTKN